MRTLEGTYTKGGTTYNYKALVPDAAVFVHSKHVFSYITITDSSSNFVVNRQIQMIATTMNTGLNEFRNTDSQGTASYDIARMLQITKGDIKNELQINQNTTVQLTKARRITISFYDSGTVIVAFFQELLTGANDTIDKWWYNRRRLRLFTNYPYTFDFQNINGNWSVGDLGGALTTEAFPYVSTNLTYSMVRINPKRQWGSDLSRNIAGKTVSAQITMATKDGSFTQVASYLDLIIDRQSFDLDKKCYLRWIGKHGEVFYWLFRKHSTVDATAKESFKRSFIGDGYDSYGVIDTEELAELKKTSTMTVFTDMLNNDEYDVVMSIINSPYVDMLVSYEVDYTPRGQVEAQSDYIYETVKWQRVTVNAGKYQTMRKSSQGFTDKKLVITLSLPEEGGLSL